MSPIWKHPVFLYTVGTFLLFLLMVGLGWVALDQGWLPTR